MKMFDTFIALSLFITCTTGESKDSTSRKGISDTDRQDLYKTESFVIDRFKVDGAYPAMTGPTKKKFVTLQANPRAKYLWVKGVEVEVFSDKNRREPLNLLCHAWITLGDKNNYSSAPEGLLTISEGMGQSLFPKGFGMYIENTPSNDIELLAQVLNDNPHFRRDLGYKFKITYLEDFSPKPSLLKPLKQVSMAAVGPAVKFKDGEMCQADGNVTDGGSVHFLVPPGRHKFSRVYQKGTFAHNTTIHFIKVHLHQYGESISLIDKTENKVLWMGRAVHKNQQIESVDSYSSPSGINVFPDHEYEIVGEYFNQSKKNVDGMAVLRMYRNASDPS